MKKYSLTEEHSAQLRPWSEKWIANAMSTKQMDDEDKSAIRTAIRGLYESAGLIPPPDNRIVFVPSPAVLRFAGGFAAAIWWLRKNHKSKLATRDATLDATYDATLDATYDATDAATRAATLDATLDATRAATRAATRDATLDATYDATDRSKWYSIDLAAIRKVASALGVLDLGFSCAQNAYNMWQGGNQWSAWVGFLSFFRHIAKLNIDYSKWQHWESASIHGGPRIMHPDFCMVSDRPKTLLVDNQNRPHNFDGPFCEWRDGFKIYSIHGVRMPAWIAETKRELFTKEMILSEQNADNRRCIIQKIGIERAIELLGAKVIDVYESKVGGKYELLLIDYSGDGNERPYLKMENPSLKNVYHIEGCRPGTNTVKDALMYRNGLKQFIEPEVLS